MSTITISRSSSLISGDSFVHASPLTIEVNASLLKPYTKVHLYLDGLNVDDYFSSDLVIDDSGNLSGLLTIPGYLVSAGNKTLLITNRADYTAGMILSANDIKARGYFKILGFLDQWKIVESRDNSSSIELSERIESQLSISQPKGILDPIAQSFFTDGMQGGCFITGIDVFFKTKDTQSTKFPVWIEIRELINGYPSNTRINQDAYVILQPNSINISDDGSIATRFQFNELVYLEENKDYCFVLQSMSNQYTLWTTRLSDVSNESGNAVFNQPFVGSMFRRENGSTWTNKQNENLKFTIYRAKFKSNTNASLELNASPNWSIIRSNQFFSINNSSECIVTLPYQHGLVENQSTIELSVDTQGIYNGIRGTYLNGTHQVTKVISSHSFVFSVRNGYTFSQSGPIITGGIIRGIQVDVPGEGYTFPPSVSIIRNNDLEVTPDQFVIGVTYTISELGDTDWNFITGTSSVEYVVGNSITVVNKGSGTGKARMFALNATASTVISNGQVSNVKMSTSGSGYFTLPTVTLTGGNSTQRAIVTAIIDDIFHIKTNHVYSSINPSVHYLNPVGTKISSKISGKLAAYEGGLNVTGESSPQYDFEFDKVNKFPNVLWLDSSQTSITSILSTSNDNVSPVIDKSGQLLFVGHSINNQGSDTISSVNTSRKITGIDILYVGSGYTSTPTLLINGEAIDATIVMDIGSIGSITLNEPIPGVYYEDLPTLELSGGNPTAPAQLTFTIDPSGYNTELYPNHGRAYSRYLTKEQVLSNISRGIRVYLTGYSNSQSSIDVYIRTTLSSSGSELDDQYWTQLNCDLTRNKSTRQNELFEYTFYHDDLQQFDVYELKIVLRSTTPWDPPFVDNYRSVIII